MKRKFNYLIGLSLCILLMTGMQAKAEEKTKEYHESWPVSSVKTLNVNNKFGKVSIMDKGGSDITIDVIITVDASSESKADDFLKLFKVNFKKTGNLLTAETYISKAFRSSKKFSVDYEVNIPSEKDLVITNKYGDVFVNELIGHGEFNIKYGNFSANKLNENDNSTELYMEYGQVNIEKAKDLEIDVQYSTINIEQLEKLNMESKYNVVKIDFVKEVKGESKYDSFNFGNLGVISVDSKYSRFELDKLIENFLVEAEYGKITIKEVDPNFKSINITNSYGYIRLGLGNNSYLVDASCDYCKILYPENRFVGDRMSENKTKKIKGKIGDGSGGKVFVKSKYGEIQIR